MSQCPHCGGSFRDEEKLKLREQLGKSETDLFAAMEVVCGVIVACETQFNLSPSMARVRDQAVSLVKPKPNCTQSDDHGATK